MLQTKNYFIKIERRVLEMTLTEVMYTTPKWASQLNCPDPEKHSKSDEHSLFWLAQH